MKMNMYKWLEEIKSSSERHAIPVMTYPGVDMVGSNVFDMVNDGRIQYECIHSLAERFPSAAAVTLMDLSVEAEAFGSTIRFSQDEAPTVVGSIVNDMESVNALEIPEVGVKRTGEYLKAAKLASGNITDRPLFGGVIGPFSLAGRLFDITQVIIEARRNKEVVHALLEKCNEFIKRYIEAFKEAGCNGVIIAEPTAGLLSPVMCQEFSSDYIRRIVVELQDENFIIILHNCGHTVKLVESMLSTGCKAYHFGNAVDMLDILHQIPSDIIAMGNLDPASVFRIGTRDTVHEKTLELLHKTSQYKNFVISSGCDIPYGTPLENVEEFYSTIANYNKNPDKITEIKYARQFIPAASESGNR